MPRTRIEYGGCSQTKRSRPRSLRPPTAPRRSPSAGTSRSRCSGPCPAGRGRSARRASRRCRCPARGGGSGRGRCSRSCRRRSVASTSRDDPAARVAELVRVVAHRAVHLGREHDVVAPAFERLADDLLGLAARVDVGGVDEVDAGVERAVDDADRARRGRCCPGRTSSPRGRGATLDAGAAEGAVVHASEVTRPGEVISFTTEAARSPSRSSTWRLVHWRGCLSTRTASRARSRWSRSAGHPRRRSCELVDRRVGLEQGCSRASLTTSGSR